MGKVVWYFFLQNRECRDFACSVGGKFFGHELFAFLLQKIKDKVDKLVEL